MLSGSSIVPCRATLLGVKPGKFLFMRAILPQERLQVIIDNSVEVIDMLDGHALHRQAQSGSSVAEPQPICEKRLGYTEFDWQQCIMR